MSALRRDPAVRAVFGAVRGGRAAYLVGGSVRRLLLSEPPSRDLDFAIAGPVGAAARRVASALSGTAFRLGKKKKSSFRVAAWRGGTHYSVDISSIEGGGITEDLKRRDFTVNAAAIDLRALFGGGASRRTGLMDPCNGATDASERVLRMTAITTLDRDPLRCLRAVRIAAEHGLTMDGATADAVRRKACLMRKKKTALERMRDELTLILSSPSAAGALKSLHTSGVADVVIPETAGWEDVDGYRLLDHALRTVEEAAKLLHDIESGAFPVLARELKAHFFPNKDAAGAMPGAPSRAALFMTAAYLHDAGKPLTIERKDGTLRFWGHEAKGAEAVKKALTRLRFSRKTAAEVSSLVKNHHRTFGLALLGKPGARALGHFFRSCGGGLGVDALMLAVADARATRGGEDPELFKVVEGALRFYFREYSAGVRRAARPLLTGREIMERLGVPEGPLVGAIMRAVAEGVEEGTVKDKTGALSYARRFLASDSIDKNGPR